MSLLLTLIVAQAATPSSGATAPVHPFQELSAEVFALTNRERAKHGLPAFRVNDNLTGAADYLALNLASRRKMEHRDGKGRGVSERYESAGYVNWSVVAENVAYGQRSPQQVVQAWMKSEGHRRNILDPSIAEIGIGVNRSADGRLYWVQAFGSRFQAK